MTVLFQDKFESGDFSLWDGTGGTTAVNTTRPHHGRYSAQFTGNSFAYKVFAGTGEVWGRAYYNFPVLPVANVSGSILRFYDAGFGQPVYLQWITDASANIFLSIQSPTTYVQSSWAMVANVWYSIELHLKKGAGTAICDGYLDNGLWVRETAQNLPNDWAIIVIGDENAPAGFVVFEDCVIVQNQYNGPERLYLPQTRLDDRINLRSRTFQHR